MSFSSVEEILLLELKDDAFTWRTYNKLAWIVSSKSGVKVTAKTVRRTIEQLIEGGLIESFLIVEDVTRLEEAHTGWMKIYADTTKLREAFLGTNEKSAQKFYLDILHELSTWDPRIAEVLYITGEPDFILRYNVVGKNHLARASELKNEILSKWEWIRSVEIYPILNLYKDWSVTFQRKSKEARIGQKDLETAWRFLKENMKEPLRELNDEGARRLTEGKYLTATGMKRRLIQLFENGYIGFTVKLNLKKIGLWTVHGLLELRLDKNETFSHVVSELMGKEYYQQVFHISRIGLAESDLCIVLAAKNTIELRELAEKLTFDSRALKRDFYIIMEHGYVKPSIWFPR